MIPTLMGVVLFLSVILHEVSHGAAARALGDPTAQRSGRLTLNPLAHIDLWGTVLLPAFLIALKAPILLGWAKPVPFDPSYFKNRRAGIFAVAAAGPLMNILLALVLAGVLHQTQAQTHGLLRGALSFGVSINLLLALFNLLPIPPLDGSKLLAVLLPTRLERAYLGLGRWGMLILIPLIYFGVVGSILLPALDALLRILRVKV